MASGKPGAVQSWGGEAPNRAWILWRYPLEDNLMQDRAVLTSAAGRRISHVAVIRSRPIANAWLMT
jgi:hypothetical protein